MNNQSKLVGAVLLIAGTIVGAGMLALPTVTGLAGFWPSCLFLLAYWGFMTYTAFLFLEVTLWMPGEGPNVITMASKTLGQWGEVVSWSLYLLLLYLLTTAYIAGGGGLITLLIQNILGVQIPTWAAVLPMVLFFAIFIYEGVKYVDYVNRLLMLGLVATYVAMVGILAPNVDGVALSHVSWKPLLLAVSLTATSFGFHIIIPTLVRYLDHDVAQLKKAIWYGSLFPIIIYCLWELVALGTIPLEGDPGIIQGYQEGIDAGKLLVKVVGSGILGQIILCFSFFAIMTSFLGVSQSLRDFLADGFHVKKTIRGRLLLDFLTFFPPLLFIFISSRAFIDALNYAGAFGVVTLLALMPALMTWKGRYTHQFRGPFKTFGGKPALVIVILLSLGVVTIEVGKKLGWMEQILEAL